jgi:hypothetical protein
VGELDTPFHCPTMGSLIARTAHSQGAVLYAQTDVIMFCLISPAVSRV